MAQHSHKITAPEFAMDFQELVKEIEHLGLVAEFELSYDHSQPTEGYNNLNFEEHLEVLTVKKADDVVIRFGQWSAGYSIAGGRVLPESIIHEPIRAYEPSDGCFHPSINNWPLSLGADYLCHMAEHPDMEVSFGEYLRQMYP